MEDDIQKINTDQAETKMDNTDLNTNIPIKKDENIFYNIMPKAKGPVVIVEPTLKINNKTQISTQDENPSFFATNKKIILGIITSLILGMGIYVGINKFITGGVESDIVLKQPVVNNNNKQAPPDATIKDYETTVQWREKYFPVCKEESLCGDKADPDHDGILNLQEFKLGTDPNNNDSDQDGLSDGDEINVFNSNPLNTRTANDPQYTDLDFAKGAYDFGTGKKMTQNQINSINSKMNSQGLHEPTIKNLFSVLNTIYNFNTSDNQKSTTTTTSTINNPDSNIDQSLEAKQDRDSQRSNTIKNIEGGLVNYFNDNKKYPIATDFSTMFANIKPYLKVATNPLDPINKDPYIYTYVSDKTGTDFTLSFYSEVANQIIKKHSVEAINDVNAEQSTALDDQRKYDLESLQTALLLYSQKNVAGNQSYVFPPADKYKTLLVPENISQIPKDPKTKLDYEYKVSPTFDTFTLKAIFDIPTAGTTGWLCNQEECRAY